MCRGRLARFLAWLKFKEPGLRRFRRLVSFTKVPTKMSGVQFRCGKKSGLERFSYAQLLGGTRCGLPSSIPTCLFYQGHLATRYVRSMPNVGQFVSEVLHVSWEQNEYCLCAQMGFGCCSRVVSIWELHRKATHGEINSHRVFTRFFVENHWQERSIALEPYA